MRHRLWSLFVEACKNSLALTEVFQERYDSFFGDRAVHVFQCDEKEICRIPALDPIYVDMGKRELAKKEHYEALYWEIGRKYFKCTYPVFHALFGGRKMKVRKPYVWHGTARQLANFLSCCMGEDKQLNRDTSEERFVPLFMNEDGHHWKANTYHQSLPCTDRQNDMVPVFNRCGIKRG